MEMSERREASAGDEDRRGLTYPNGRGPTIQKKRLPPRTCCLAVVLTSLGVALLIVSLHALITGNEQFLPLIFMSMLTLIPGSYASWHLIGIKLRWPGYDNMVIFNDDLELV